MTIKKFLRNSTIWLFVSAASLQAASLVWDANSEPDLAGYIVSYGIVGTTVTNNVFVTTNRYALNSLPLGYYWSYVRATNTAGLTSDPSNIILYSLPRPPSSLRPVQP